MGHIAHFIGKWSVSVLIQIKIRSSWTKLLFWAPAFNSALRHICHSKMAEIAYEKYLIVNIVF